MKKQARHLRPRRPGEFGDTPVCTPCYVLITKELARGRGECHPLRFTLEQRGYLTFCSSRRIC